MSYVCVCRQESRVMPIIRERQIFLLAVRTSGYVAKCSVSQISATDGSEGRSFTLTEVRSGVLVLVVVMWWSHL